MSALRSFGAMVNESATMCAVTRGPMYSFSTDGVARCVRPFFLFTTSHSERSTSGGTTRGLSGLGAGSRDACGRLESFFFVACFLAAAAALAVGVRFRAYRTGIAKP